MAWTVPSPRSMWADTADHPERKERRMAECLVRNAVPWLTFTEIVAPNAACARTAQGHLASLGATDPSSCQTYVVPLGDSTRGVGRRG